MKKNNTLNGIAKNPLDPLPRLAPQNATALLEIFAAAAHNFGMKDVVDASGSLVITVLRQRFQTRREAEAAFDEIFGKMKQALVDHYDTVSGRKKGIFPYDQHIHPDLVINPNKIILPN